MTNYIESILKIVLTISIITLCTSAFCQVSYSENPSDYVCGNYDSGGHGIRFKVWPTPIPGNEVTFRVRKVKNYNCNICSGNCDFGTSGTLRIREGSVNGTIIVSCNLSGCGGDDNIDLSKILTFQTGSKSYYATLETPGFTYTAGPIVITANPADDPQLDFSECLEGNPSVTQGEEYNLTFEVENIGDTEWNGDLVAFIAQNGGGIAQVLYENEDLEIDPNDEYAVNTGNDEINLSPGGYKVFVAYTNGPNGDSYVTPGNCVPTISQEGTITHYLNLFVSAPGNGLVLSEEINASPNPFVQSQNATINTEVTNTSSSTWAGQLGMKLKNLATNLIVDIINPVSVNLDQNESISLVRPSSPITSAPGSYQILIQFRPTGTNTWTNVSEGNFENPLPIQIVSSPEIITITNPNNPVNYNSGQNVNITWTSSGIGSNVSIELISQICNSVARVVADPTNNDGSYSWNIPNSIPDGNYKIKIYETGTGDGVDYSDNYFSITNTGITITVPNGGQSYAVGQSIPIAWTSTGIGNNVTIEIVDNCNTPQIVIANPTVNDGSFSWPIPVNLPNGAYRIKMYETVTNNGTDLSNNTFTINTSGSCADGFENNNTLATAHESAFSLLGGVGYSHFLSTPTIHEISDEDYFKVSYSVNGTLTIALTNLPANYALFLLDMNGNQLDASQNTGLADEQVAFTFSGAGDFYIKIIGQTGSQYNCNPYNLSLSWLPSVSGACSNFADLSPNDPESYNAAVCLCELGYITPQDYNEDGILNELNPDASILRADLAKMVFYALFEGDNPAYSDSFPVPFVDLEQFYIPYYRYAKALSYLEYGDGISPFSRDFINFRPFETILKRDVLKVMLEAFNIPPDPAGPNPFPGEINLTDKDYGYIKEAHDRGYIITGNLNAPLARKNAFIILHRILSDDIYQDCDGECDPNCHPLIEDQDFFIPGNFTPQNLSRSIAMDEGYYAYASPTGISIPGIGLNLAYSHSYHSHLMELPPKYTEYATGSYPNISIHSLKPLGNGWSHSYHAYLMKIPGWSDSGQNVPDMIMVFWPGGEINFFDATSLESVSYGVFDQLTQINATSFRIKKKNQVEYTFTRLGGEWDDPYFLTSINDRNNNTVKINYEAKNGSHRIKDIEDTVGRFLKFYYQANNNYLAQVKDVAGNRTILYNVQSSHGNLLSYTNARGKITSYSYDPSPSKHLLTTITLPEGNVITNTYGDHSKLSMTQVANGSEAISQTFDQVYNYSSPTSPLQTTTQDGQQTSIVTTYNPNGFAKSTSINDANLEMLREVQDFPSLISHIEYESQQADIEYDDRGNMKKITLPMGVIHEYEYNHRNDIIWYKDPRGNKSYIYYDSKGNIDYTKDNMGFVTDFSVNSKGQITSIENPEGIVTTFAYDAFGNQKTITQPLGIIIKNEFDVIGRLKKTINPNNQVTEYLFDVHNQLKKATRHVQTGNIITENQYDDNDNLLWIENALGHKTTMSYNDRDQVESQSFGNDTKSFTYLNDGLLDTYSKPGSSGVFNYEYDDLGRIETDGHTNYTYWGNKQLIKDITLQGRTITMYYDDLNRLDRYTDYYGKTVEYDYDANSNITRITYPGGFKVNYTYDKNNRMVKVEWDNASKKVIYTYREDGLLRKATMPNGTYTEYEYDDAGRMESLVNKKSNGSVICSYEFELDKNGNHLAENPVEPFGTPQFEPFEIVSTYNNENEILNSGTTSFSHDANGNITSKGSTNLTWDIYDRLLTYGNDAFEYDGAGTRRKVIRGGQIIKYVWDIQGIKNILMELDNAGSPDNYYIHGLGLIARRDAGSGDESYYHYDFRGSTIAMTNENEAITHQYQYAPFGEILNSEEQDENPFRYVGKYGVMHEVDNLYYMRARYADASIGRFLNEDVIWKSNLFNYALNNPILYSDPEGLLESSSYGAGHVLENNQTLSEVETTLLDDLCMIVRPIIDFAKPDEAIQDYAKDKVVENIDIPIVAGSDEEFVKKAITMDWLCSYSWELESTKASYDATSLHKNAKEIGINSAHDLIELSDKSDGFFEGIYKALGAEIPKLK